MTETIDTANLRALAKAADAQPHNIHVVSEWRKSLLFQLGVCPDRFIALVDALAAAEAENDILRQHAAKQITDSTLLTGINFNSGSMDIGMQGGAARLLAESFFDQFIESGAVNYLEVRFDSQEKMPGKSMVVTLQLVDGLTPAQKLAELKAALAAAEARNATLTDDAARYRWLRDMTAAPSWYAAHANMGISCEVFDMRLDAEIARAAATKEKTP